MEQHHLAILVPEATGGWTMLFPGPAGLRDTWRHDSGGAVDGGRGGTSPSCHDARGWARDFGAAQCLEAVQADREWAEGRGIDWSKVVISNIKPGRISEMRSP